MCVDLLGCSEGERGKLGYLYTGEQWGSDRRTRTGRKGMESQGRWGKRLCVAVALWDGPAAACGCSLVRWACGSDVGMRVSDSCQSIDR